MVIVGDSQPEASARAWSCNVWGSWHWGQSVCVRKVAQVGSDMDRRVSQLCTMVHVCEFMEAICGSKAHRLEVHRRSCIKSQKA